MYCVKCGTQVSSDNVFCHNCGTPIIKEHSSLTPLKDSPHTTDILQSDASNNLLTHEDTDYEESEFETRSIKLNYKMRISIIAISIIAIFSTVILGFNIFQDKTKEVESSKLGKIYNSLNLNSQNPQTEEEKFIALLKTLNESENSIEKISIYENNYNPGTRQTSYQWDPSLFYSLEDISPGNYSDGLINSYIIEKKQLINADTGNLIEYEIYKNPDNNKVNKIVSIEYKGNMLEITDYYYTDSGKVNFIFSREDTNYVPSYATQDKSGLRYYFTNDTMVKWRIVDNSGQRNYIIGEQEKNRGGNAGTISLYNELSDDIKMDYDNREKKMLNAAYNTYNIVLQSKGISSIVGYVTDQDGNPLKDATIHLFAQEFENEVYVAKTDNSGKYSILIPSEERSYFIKVTKNNYIETILYNINQNNQLIGMYQETIVLISNSFTSSTYNTQLVISDAFNKSYDNSGMMRLDSASINVRKGINNKTGEIYASATTDNNGIVYMQLEPGMYTVEINKVGYAVNYYTITVVSDNTMINVNTTPVLNEGEVRIVLTWNDTPWDLDSHLFTPYDETSGDSTYHIWYGNQFDYNGNNLDVDDTDGYGPETMTINELGNGLYKFYVADYTNCSNQYPTSTDMSYSNATVSVYTEQGLVHSFNVPANRPGVIWEVFEIRNKTIVPLQRYYSNLDNKTWWNNDK